MGIRETIMKEAADLRAKGAALLQDAQSEAQQFEARAVALEQKLESIPAEVEALAEDAVDRVRAWFKGL